MNQRTANLSLSDYASFDETELDRIIQSESVEPSTSPSTRETNKEGNLPSPSFDPYQAAFNEILAAETGDDIGVKVQQPVKTGDPYVDDFFLTEQEEQEEEQLNSAPEDIEEITDPYQLTIKLASELDLLRLPDDIKLEDLSADDLRFYANETRKIQYEEVIEDIRNNVANDPYMSDLIDYAIEGRGFADLPKMQTILDTEMRYEALDTTDVKVQKALVNRYLKEGLDPNNPRDNQFLNLIPTQINTFENNLTLRAEAEKAKQFFIMKQQARRDEEFKRVEELRLQEEQEQERIVEENKQWDSDFKRALKESKMSDSRKNDIIAQTRPYHYNDGIVPLWKIKQDLIFSDPVLFQQYLAFVSNFDENQKQFTSSPTKEKNSIVDQITNNLNKKGDTSGNVNRSQGQDYSKKTTKRNTFDPRKEQFY